MRFCESQGHTVINSTCRTDVSCGLGLVTVIVASVDVTEDTVLPPKNVTLSPATRSNPLHRVR